ncbi:hypothetical protein N9164_17330 [Draconibacterium sp.]|nr:hypothetical protein [Draconibacterium sp.]
MLVVLILIFVIGATAETQETEKFDSYKEMVASAKNEIEEISVTDFHKIYTKTLGVTGSEFTLIDIRTKAEYGDGFIPGAFLVQRGVLESRLGKDEVWEAFNHTKPKNSDVIIL